MIWIIAGVSIPVLVVVLVGLMHRARSAPTLPALDEREIAEHGRPLATHVEVMRGSDKPRQP